MTFYEITMHEAKAHAMTCPSGSESVRWVTLKEDGISVSAFLTVQQCRDLAEQLLMIAPEDGKTEDTK